MFPILVFVPVILDTLAARGGVSSREEIALDIALISTKSITCVLC